MLSVITGPSRTADIEKTLVMGAHGPRQLFVILVETPATEDEI
jgi:L-lactate dehydrogenase complex protein LldG